ncbi:MAG: hypothetical protein JXX28_09310 [Deltaproteobacteria bacterium]|nr:hypothetical protein [Deltaproteobacteria bacterium]
MYHEHQGPDLPVPPSPSHKRALLTSAAILFLWAGLTLGSTPASHALAGAVERAEVAWGFDRSLGDRKLTEEP